MTAFKIVSHIKPPKIRRTSHDGPIAEQKAMEAYRNAYRLVYGVTPPNVRYENGSIKGIDNTGISAKICKQRTKQLLNRKEK